MLGNYYVFVEPNKKISVFWVTGLKILGRVGTHIFFKKKNSEKKYIILCILIGVLPFRMHKIIFFPENLKKSRFHQGRVTLNTGFSNWPCQFFFSKSTFWENFFQKHCQSVKPF